MIVGQVEGIVVSTMGKIGRRSLKIQSRAHEIRPLGIWIKRMRSRLPAAKEAEQLGEEDLTGLRELLTKRLRYEPKEKAAAEYILEYWIQEQRAGV